MNAKELRAKSVDELTNVINDSKKELFNIRFQMTAGEFTNTSKVSKLKKTIARVKTILAAKENGDK